MLIGAEAVSSDDESGEWEWQSDDSLHMVGRGLLCEVKKTGNAGALKGIFL